MAILQPSELPSAILH